MRTRLALNVSYANVLRTSVVNNIPVCRSQWNLHHARETQQQPTTLWRWKLFIFFPSQSKGDRKKLFGCTRKFHNRNILLHIYMQNCALLHCRHCRLDNTRICVTEIVVVILHFYKMPKITQRLRKIGFYFRSISHCEMKNGEKGCANFLLENANVENEND